MAAGSEDLITEPLFNEHYLLVCSVGHLLGKRTEADLSNLTREKLICVSPNTANCYIVDQAQGEKSEPMNWVHGVTTRRRRCTWCGQGWFDRDAAQRGRRAAV